MDFDFLNKYYINLLNRLKRDPNLYLIIKGFADERGEETYNCNLAFERGLSVKKYLISIGFPKERLTVISVGETTQFDNEIIENYKHFFFNPYELSSKRKIRLQLNRRVEVIYSNLDKSKKETGCKKD